MLFTLLITLAALKVCNQGVARHFRRSYFVYPGKLWWTDHPDMTKQILELTNKQTNKQTNKRTNKQFSKH